MTTGNTRKSSVIQASAISKSFPVSRIVLLFVLGLSMVFANSTAQANQNFDRLSIPGFSISTDPSVPASNLLSYEPKGDNLESQSPDCRPDILEQLASTNSGDRSLDAKQTNEYIQKCQSRWNRGLKQGLGALIQLASIQYSAILNPNIRRVKIKLEDGVILTGFLALKDDQMKRPFVIAQCGVLCGIDNAMAHTLMMQLFEETPFNVLVLSNVTSADFVKANGMVRIGGIQEGAGLFEIAQKLRSTQSSVRELLDSVHVVGQSLGGHSALFSAVYASYSKEKNILQSVTAICPVVDLDRSVSHFKSIGGIMGVVTESEFSSTFKEVHEYNPTITYLMKAKDLSFGEQLEVLSQANFGFLRKKIQAGEWRLLPPLEREQLRTMDEYRTLADVKRYVSGIQIPTLVIGSSNDVMVDYKQNAGALQTAAQGVQNSNLGFVKYALGGHCGESMAIGWPTVTSLLRGSILRNSPKFLVQKRSQKVAIEASSGFTIQKPKPTSAFAAASDKAVSFIPWQSVIWSTSVGTDFITATLKKSPDQACSAPTTVANCIGVEAMKINVPYSQLNRALLPPQTEADANRNTRWANSNLLLQDASGKSIFQTGAMPSFVSFDRY